MTNREKFIIKAALVYAQSNLDDVNMAFDDREWQHDENVETISVFDEKGEAISEPEIAELLFSLE